LTSCTSTPGSTNPVHDDTTMSPRSPTAVPASRIARSAAAIASAVASAVYLVAALGFSLTDQSPVEITLAGTPSHQLLDQTATASRASLSIGKPTE